MPKLSDEQIAQAREIDLLEYLLTYEPTNVRQSKGRPNQHEMVEYDSLKISNGKWFRHSTQEGGFSALDFLVKIRGVHFVDAVQSLTSGYVISSYQSKSSQKTKPPPALLKPFILPKPNRNNDRVVAYLRGRGIGRDVIKQVVSARLLYESLKHRCVFVGKDENSKPMFACERGTTDDWKKDIAGSNKQYGFVLPPSEPNGRGNTTLAVFESPIDTLAHATIHDIGQTGWDGYRLSLGGVSSKALQGFLERNKQISNIQLCLDNDKAGHKATNRIIDELLNDKRYSHIKITIAPPPIGKDYADTLQAIRQNSIERPANRPKEAVF